VTLAKAITALRKKLQYNQAEFAKTIQVKPVTISRYENGRQPKGEVIKRLADLAEKADAPHLRDLFEATWKGGVASKIENLPSPGAERRIPKFWFEIWMSRQESIFRASTGLIRKGAYLTASQRAEVLEGIRGLAEQTWRDLRIFRTDHVPELDPNEDFSKSPPLYGTLSPGERDWMGCLFGPPAVRSGGLLSRSMRRGKGEHEPK
jgi:transcriptional regulator with XRE-family HTH domain